MGISKGRIIKKLGLIYRHMKFNKMLAKLLGEQVVERKDGQAHLSEEQDAKLKTLLGEEDARILLSQVNAELSEVRTAQEELAEVKSSLEEKEKEVDVQASSVVSLEAKVSELLEVNKDLQAKVDKLSQEPEEMGSINKEVMKNGLSKVYAVAGQLFGMEGKVWDVSSPWNALALSGARGSTTDFRSSAVIERMNDEFLDFVRTYPEKIESLFQEHFSLPEHWERIYGVIDRLSTASISVANVTQPRKARWSPKGDIVFKAEEMKVYPTQIDLQFNYFEMQKIETNWLHSFNKEGSFAYKMPFIMFLLDAFLKKARQEDADVLIRGVHVETPEYRDKEKAVSYLFRNDGLLKLIFDAKHEGKYRPFKLGAWSFQKSVDYIDHFIEMIPDTVRNSEQLQMVLAPSKIKDYKRRYEQLFGANTDYVGYPQTPKDYPNIKFVPLQQLEGSDVILVTTMDNIKVLEYKPEEKSMATIERFLRDVYIFVDYRMGIGLNHIGLATVPGDPLALVKQMIWTNDVPLFSANFFATSYDDKTGILKVRHNRVRPDSDFSTDIEGISGNVGDILILRGDASLVTDVKVKHSAKISLADNADFSLRSGGDLTLIKLSDGTYKEVSRTSVPALDTTEVEFGSLNLEYSADEHRYVGAEGTLAHILGGLEGNRVRIYGGANALTIDNVPGHISVTSAYVLDSKQKFMDLVFVGGVWTEISRG